MTHAIVKNTVFIETKTFLYYIIFDMSTVNLNNVNLKKGFKFV